MLNTCIALDMHRADRVIGDIDLRPIGVNNSVDNRSCWVHDGVISEGSSLVCFVGVLVKYELDHSVSLISFSLLSSSFSIGASGGSINKHALAVFSLGVAIKQQFVLGSGVWKIYKKLGHAHIKSKEILVKDFVFFFFWERPHLLEEEVILR